MEDSKQAQQIIAQAQAYQQQLQAFMIQKETLGMQLAEAERALQDLEKSGDNSEVYKISGPLLIRTSKADAQKELAEKQDMAKMRLKSIEKNEKKIKEKIEELRDRVQNSVSGGKGAG